MPLLTSPPEQAFDRLMMDLEERDLEPLEARVLLWLGERDSTPAELTDALASEHAATQRAVGRLERRGLVRRRTDGGPRDRSVVGATVAGLTTVRPLVEQVAGTGEASEYSLWRERAR
jgi:DNA-binding MarR family transcriptional regulator